MERPPMVPATKPVRTARPLTPNARGQRDIGIAAGPSWRRRRDDTGSMTLAGTAPDLARLRLRNQRLVGAPSEGASEAVRWMLAMQAQDYAGVLWSVGVRTPGSR